jgi:hypothetical protein
MQDTSATRPFSSQLHLQLLLKRLKAPLTVKVGNAMIDVGRYVDVFHSIADTAPTRFEATDVLGKLQEV